MQQPPSWDGSPPGQPPQQQGYVVPCRACSNPVSPAAFQCPRCGHPVLRPQAPAHKSSAGLVIALVVVGLLVAGLGVGGYAVYASYTPTCGNYGEPPCPGDNPAQGQAPVAVANDGNDPHQPVLSPDDAAFADPRRGWEWSNRCYNEDKARKYGWAMAACQKGLDLPDLDAKVKPLLLYNQGLALEGGGDNAGAKALYERSLALRSPNDSGRTEVAAALARVGGNAPAAAAPGAAPTCPGNEALYTDGQCHIFCRTGMPCPANMECSGFGTFADGNGKGPFCVPTRPAATGGCGINNQVCGAEQQCCKDAPTRSAGMSCHNPNDPDIGACF